MSLDKIMMGKIETKEECPELDSSRASCKAAVQGLRDYSDNDNMPIYLPARFGFLLVFKEQHEDTKQTVLNMMESIAKKLHEEYGGELKFVQAVKVLTERDRCLVVETLTKQL